MTDPRVILIILDGWGHSPDPEVSAIAKADIPFMRSIYKQYPNAELVTHGMAVGLPEGQMGNSEVGHLNIGAGRVVYQELARINRAIEDGELEKSPALRDFVVRANQHNARIHIMGLVSDGGVHSHIDHCKAVCKAVSDQADVPVFLHAFTDGRDVDPKSGVGFIRDMEEYLKPLPVTLASVIGRYYAMDRDRRWERTREAYDMLVLGKGKRASDLVSAIQESYSEGVTDEFVKPIVKVDDYGEPVAQIRENDAVLFFNFRTDRPRQLVTVLSQKNFPDHDMHKLDLIFLTMTEYDDTYEGISVMYEDEDLPDTLGEVLSNLGKTQLRIAETEKYPHVTYFFSGGREQPFDGEERVMIPSPKVATYDLQPSMSAIPVTDAVIAYIEEHQPDFICLNYANPDMVGHTGIFEAAVEAVETVDACMRRLVPYALGHDYGIMVIADHGNADTMRNPDGTPHTAHTKNPVPCIYISKNSKRFNVRPGKLGDLAPTILSLLGEAIPEVMTGEVLVVAK